MKTYRSIAYCAVFLLLSKLVAAQTIPQGQRLKDINPNLYVGVSIQSGGADATSLLTNNTGVQKVFKREFNLGQTTCYPAWETWTGEKQYNLTGFNNVVNWFYANDVKISAHLLAGPNTYFPEWLKTGTYTNEELESILHDWIKTVIESNDNATKVDYWNVVNEALASNGKYYASTDCKWQQLGWEDDQSGLTGADKVNAQHPVWVRRAFEYAAEYTDKILELRDYNADFWNVSKSKAFHQLVKHLLNSGVPLHAVGLQGHFNLDGNYDWSKLTQAIQEYKKLGLEVYITEIDLGDVAKSWSTAKATRQREQYKQMTQAIVEGGAEWICFWGIRDNTNEFWRYNESPLIFDNNLNPKPAYYGVQEGLAVVTSVAGETNSPYRIKNPIKDEILIESDYFDGKRCDVTLLSQSGQPVFTAEVTAQQSRLTSKIPGHISPGFYIVRVATRDGVKNFKLIKE
jgi:GH35 family endo-1,4-beta-xylanase